MAANTVIDGFAVDASGVWSQYPFINQYENGGNKVIKPMIEAYVPYDEQEKCDKEVMLEYINNFEDILTRKNRIGHFSASAWVVNRQRTKVLMIYHNIYDSWAWTGGHVDGSTDLLGIALREVEEETGLKTMTPINNDIFSIEILPVNYHIKNGSFISTHVHLNTTFLLEADETESLILNEIETSGVKWVNINEIDSIVSEEHMKPIYRKLNKKMALQFEHR